MKKLDVMMLMYFINNNENRYIVTMAGGVGERFWSLKHFCNVFGSDKCILEQTIENLMPKIERLSVETLSDKYRE